MTTWHSEGKSQVNTSLWNYRQISILWGCRNFRSWTWLVCLELDIMPRAWENQLQVISGVKYLIVKTYIIPTKNFSSTVCTIQPNINSHISKLDFYQWEITKTANNRNRHLLLELSDINCKMTVLTVAAAKLLQSCPTLCDPMDCSLPGFSVPGILQARTLEWVAISFSNAWKWKVKVKSLSRVRLLATPWTAAYQAPPSMGFSGQQYWSGVPLPSPMLTVFNSIKDRFEIIKG